MYGGAVDTLNVYRMVQGVTGKPVWTLKGERGGRVRGEGERGITCMVARWICSMCTEWCRESQANLSGPLKVRGGEGEEGW